MTESDQVDLVQLLLNNPRDWSMSAHGLFKKALPIIAELGSEAEHKEISTKLQKLFSKRNKIAHEGEHVEPDEAKQHVAAADEAMQYIRGLFAVRDPKRYPNVD